MEAPDSEERLAEAVRACPRVLPRGGGSKPALRRLHAEDEPCADLSLGRWTGIEEYEPSEFTVTVRSGTPCAELEDELAAKGQQLPFEPLFSAEGSTVGGTIAAGLSGPGSLRFGGLRDFLLGVTWIDGVGRRLSAGGRVVKNAAGFDLPRFFVGSLGRFGLLTRAVFKVFPLPRRRLTFQVGFASMGEAMASWAAVARGPWEFEALEIDCDPVRWTGRFAGGERAVEARLQRFRRETGLEARELSEASAEAYWGARRSLGWIPGADPVVRIPVRPSAIAEWDAEMAEAGLWRSYGNGGHVAWVAGPPEFGPMLERRRLCGLVLRGQGVGPWIGCEPAGTAVACGLKEALDAEGRFPLWPPPRTGAVIQSGDAAPD